MIDLGDPIPNLALNVYDSTGALADGGNVALTITLPDGTTINPTVVKSATGKYFAAYYATQAGYHSWVWTVTGANAGVHTDAANVENRPAGIVSLAETKTYLKISRTDTDEQIRLLIRAASDACESAEGTNRVWRRTSYVNEAHSGGGPVIELFHAPVLQIDSITADGSAVVTEDYDLNLRTGRLWASSGHWPYSGRRFGVKVSYTAGSNQIPPLVRDGVMEMTRHLLSVTRGGSNLPSQGDPEYATALGYLVPNRVSTAWRAHRRSGLG